MRITESCAECLYDKQKHLTDNETYLARVREIIENRSEEDTSPYLVYLFDKEYVKCFGERYSYADIKKQYNDLMLSMEAEIRKRIEESDEPLKEALFLARVGNYIDFGAMNHVDTNVFLQLFEHVQISARDEKTYQSFLEECEHAKNFLLVADNCGEIVLDKLMLEQLRRRFPKLDITVLVRGGEVLNDVIEEDASYVGIDKVARILPNGAAVAGTIYGMLNDAAKEVLDHADVILAKGQGNYESLSNHGRHIFFAFLCKCDHFAAKFGVEKLTGMFVEER
ncbi:MAG: ARMT1-like domain-containing protein [Acetatifactor sp.]|nr:ARMT1-like domain-containing protein [Acetatifactor sp.]